MPNTLIIHQRDDKISALPEMKALGNDLREFNGNLVQVHEMVEMQGVKGDPLIDHPRAYSAIEGFTDAVLARVQDDLVEIQIIFMFHQTKKYAVLAILATMADVRVKDLFRRLAEQHVKQLRITSIVLLSCESATDKVLTQPIRDGLERYVAQAQLMRSEATDAFKTLQGPPYPVSGPPGINYPSVVTFSTGNVDRGGIIMNPFAAKFVDLDGHVDPDGNWVLDDPNTYNPEGTPTSGTIYTDQPGVPTTQNELDPGEPENFMGFPPPAP